jgi:eukaryotic-like serine/threonine-protein kinase
MIGETLDGTYLIRRLLGEGGMGAVYEGQHQVTGRRVAIKVINAVAGRRAGALERFTREAKVVSSVETQHIVQIYDAGRDQTTGSPYITMELLDGEDVQQLIRRVGPLAPDLALRIAAQACLGLAKAHGAGIVHRDIKPANLFLARRDAGEVIVKLLDFGIAKSMEGDASKESLTATGSVLGSPSYMSPEQVKGLKSIDARTDIWSLGAVIYEMLTGLVPYHRSETIHQLIMAICGELPPPIQDLAPWVPPEIAGVVHVAMQHDVAQRFRGAGAMLEQIKQLLPQGSWAMHEQMLVPLAPQARKVVAPRADLRTSAAMVLGNQGQSAVGGITAGAYTTGPAAPTAGKRPPLGVLLAVGAALAIGGVAVAFKVLPDDGASGVPASAVPPPPTPAAVVEPAPRTVRVTVPAGATVEVDGAPAPVDAGSVGITGKLGSRHKVRLVDGARELTSEVVIAEDGALPDRLELPAPVVSATATATAAAPFRRPPAGGGAAKAPPPATGAPVPGMKTKFE